MINHAIMDFYHQLQNLTCLLLLLRRILDRSLHQTLSTRHHFSSKVFNEASDSGILNLLWNPLLFMMPRSFIAGRRAVVDTLLGTILDF